MSKLNERDAFIHEVYWNLSLLGNDWEKGLVFTIKYREQLLKINKLHNKP